jgi:hypothetical protein
MTESQCMKFSIIMDVPNIIVDIFDRLDPPQRKRKLNNKEVLASLVYVIGDKGYISRHIEEALRARNMRLLTPQRTNCRHPRIYSKEDRNSLRRRHKVENLFCRMDKFKKMH